MDSRQLKKVIVYVVTALISLLFIVYIATQMVTNFGAKIETVEAAYVTERSLTPLNAYIIRKEELVYSSIDGNVKYNVSNGERVGVGSTVATVYDIPADVSAKLIDIDNKINLLKSSNVSDDMVLADTATLDIRITELYTEISDRLSQGDIQYAMAQKNNLLALLNRRQILVKAVSDYNDNIAMLEEEKAVLLESVGENIHDITTDISGYFYTEADGYEEAFSEIDIDTFTIQGYRNLAEKQPDMTSGSNENGKLIGKIVRSYAWYIVCEIPFSESHSYVNGKSYTIIYPYNGDKELQATLYRTITEPGSDRAVLVFKNGMIIDGFNFLRSQSIELVNDSYSGYRVPISAVRIVNGEKGVFVLNGSVVKFRTINPLFEKNGYVIVEPRDLTNPDHQTRLNIGENIIIGGGEYYDGQLVS